MIAAKIATLRQKLFEPFETFEQRSHSLFISLLRRGKPRLVNSVIDRVINSLVQFINGSAQSSRIKIPLCGTHLIEGAVEHANDVGGFVADDGCCLPIP